MKMASRCSGRYVGANGVARRGYATRDEQRAADVSLSNVQVAAMRCWAKSAKVSP